MTTEEPKRPRTWLVSDRLLARNLAQPVRQFLEAEAGGGIALLAATAVALVWANSPLQDSYDALIHTELSLRIGTFELAEDLQHWVNDGLMAIFFFVVGIEVKRELSEGELSNPKRAAFPSVAALGGMIVPALIYLVFNSGGEAGRGWGIPMATDIAFAVGVLSLFGSRVTTSMKVFLLSLAVADDIGAIVVIALFYTADLNLVPLAIAVVLLASGVILGRIHVTYVPIYVALAVGTWFATFQSGVHATIAGVALGLLTPVRPRRDEDEPAALPRMSADEGRISSRRFRAWKLDVRQHIAIGEHLEEILVPWSSYVVIPIFALVNAGVTFTSESFATALESSVTLGVALGLVVGKIVGITLFSFVAQKAGFAEVPGNTTWPQLAGVAAVAGIGFTVSLFVTELAFEDPVLIEEAKLGIFVASVVAAGVGGLVLRLTTSREAEGGPKVSAVPEKIEG